MIYTINKNKLFGKLQKITPPHPNPPRKPEHAIIHKYLNIKKSKFELF